MTQSERHKMLIKEVVQLMKATRNSGTPGRDQPSWETTAACVLHLVNSYLADVTEEMVRAHDNHDGDVQEPFQSTYRDSIVSDWRAMLSASALVSGREG